MPYKDRADTNACNKKYFQTPKGKFCRHKDNAGKRGVEFLDLQAQGHVGLGV